MPGKRSYNDELEEANKRHQMVDTLLHESDKDRAQQEQERAQAQAEAAGQAPGQEPEHEGSVYDDLLQDPDDVEEEEKGKNHDDGPASHVGADADADGDVGMDVDVDVDPSVTEAAVARAAARHEHEEDDDEEDEEEGTQDDHVDDDDVDKDPDAVIDEDEEDEDDEEAQAQGKSSSKGKSSAKAEPKDESKDESKNEPKDESKDEPKDEQNGDGDGSSVVPGPAIGAPARRGRKPGTETGTPAWKIQRKESHKEVERRRRMNINANIEKLSELLPVKETSKALILSRAAEYIQKMKETEAANIEKWTLQKLLGEQQASTLQSQNEKLEEELSKAFKTIEELKKKLKEAGIDAGEAGSSNAAGATTTGSASD